MPDVAATPEGDFKAFYDTWWGPHPGQPRHSGRTAVDQADSGTAFNGLQWQCTMAPSQALETRYLQKRAERSAALCCAAVAAAGRSSPRGPTSRLGSVFSDIAEVPKNEESPLCGGGIAQLLRTQNGRALGPHPHDRLRSAHPCVNAAPFTTPAMLACAAINYCPYRASHTDPLPPTPRRQPHPRLHRHHEGPT